MRIHWWSLPGPSSFVEQVLAEIREGKSVFLYLPENYPKRLSSVFREALQDDYRWLSLSSYDGGDPVEYLFESCASDVNRAGLRTVQDLVQQESFQGQAIWLEGLGTSCAEVWAPFFIEYERASRALPVARQTILIVLLEGMDCQTSFPSAVGLSHCKWDNCLRRTDMPLYSAFLIEARASSLETDLVIALVATLSGWDPILCEFLAPLDLAELITPREKLLSFAEQRGWSPHQGTNLDLSSWQRGFWQTVDGKPMFHTTLSSTDAEIDRLIWKAEVGVLLPYIEEQRQILLDRYARNLTVPFLTSEGVLIDDVHDMEIGMIHYQLRDNLAIPAETRAVIRHLKEARNSLSHLEPIKSAVLHSMCNQASSECASLKRQRSGLAV